MAARGTFIARARHRASSVTLVHVHLTLTAIWAVMMIPTLIWWRDSVLFVSAVSLYANAATHFGAYQAARAERAATSESD